MDAGPEAMTGYDLPEPGNRMIFDSVCAPGKKQVTPQRHARGLDPCGDDSDSNRRESGVRQRDHFWIIGRTHQQVNQPSLQIAGKSWPEHDLGHIVVARPSLG